MKIVILADAHVGLPETQFPGQDFTYAADLLRRAVSMIAAEEADEVVVCGDLVNQGTPAEFELVNEILLPLAADLRIVPGNHDVVRADAHTFASAVRGAVLNDVIDRGPFVRVLLNTAVHKPLPAGLYQWYGELGDDAFDALEEAVDLADARPILAFAHHPPAGTVRTLNEPMMTLINSNDLLDQLLPHEAPVVLFVGHNHRPDVWRNRNLTIVTVPPLAFWPHAYLVAEVQGGLLTVTTRRVIESPDDSPHERSRTDADYRLDCEPTMPTFTLRLGTPTYAD